MDHGDRTDVDRRVRLGFTRRLIWGTLHDLEQIWLFYHLAQAAARLGRQGSMLGATLASRRFRAQVRPTTTLLDLRR